MLENVKIENTICEPTHMSRFIASWRNSGGDYYGDEFMDWLMSMGIDEKTAMDAREMANCGKLELEIMAKRYLKAHKEHEYLY